jgi:hypothetical protein
LQLFAQHLETQMGVVNAQAGDVAQRLTHFANDVRNGLLGIPAALRNLGPTK